MDWYVHVDKSRTFQVNITYASNKEWEWKPLEIIVGSSSFKTSVIYTDDWFVYHKFPVGFARKPMRG